MGLFGKKKTEEKQSGGPDLSRTYELAIRAISDGALVIDSALNVSLANPAMLKIIGWGGDDVLGLNYKSVLTLLGKDSQPLPDDSDPVLYVQKTGQAIETKDLSILTKVSNEKVPVALTVIPSEGNIVITARDIDAELREEEARSEFISTASHEMRTPVASIEGYLGLALNPDTATIDQRAHDYLSKAHEASQHLGKLFQDLLDSTKLDDNLVKPDLQMVDIMQLAREAYGDQKDLVAKKGLQFIFAPDTMETKEKTLQPVLYAKADPTLLREVIDNLIENATKYTPSGSIEVNARADSTQISVTVKDSGIGVAPEDIGHLFQKFYRVDSTDTREIGGTGLGLYIAKKRIESIGGQLQVESELGKGSTFIIVLPRLSAQEIQTIKTMGARIGGNQSPFGGP